MPLLRTLHFRLRALFRRGDLEREMDEELRFHLEMEARDHAADGVAPDEARRLAAVEFGGKERIREEIRDARGWRPLEGLIRDLRLAGRTLRRSPGFALIAVITLSVGIAATASLFSLVNGLLRDPLPYPDADRLFQVWEKDQSSTFDFRPLSTPDFFKVRDRMTAFEAFGVFSVRRFNLGGDHATLLKGAMCTPGIFQALGVAPMLGRVFSADDDSGTQGALVILSHQVWRDQFDSDPACIGRTLRLDGREHVIVGVMPEGFALLSAWTREKSLGLWTLMPLARSSGRRNGYWLASMARLKTGVSPDAATAELRSIASEIAHSDPTANPRSTF